MTNLTDPLLHFIRLLGQYNIPYAVIGGIAVTILAQNRFTDDVDFTITLDEKQAKILERHFRNDPSYKIHQLNFISLPNIPDMFRIFWKEIPVDLLVANTDFQKEIVMRAKTIDYEGQSVRVATPEDLIVLKLLADRPIDRQDIDSLIKATKTLEWTYIEKWARVWEIEDKLIALRQSTKRNS
jgi:predicted nucleotidyltransferase